MVKRLMLKVVLQQLMDIMLTLKVLAHLLLLPIFLHTQKVIALLLLVNMVHTRKDGIQSLVVMGLMLKV